MQIYSDHARENEAYALPDVEVFKVTAREAKANRLAMEEAGETEEGDFMVEPGWYYWFCFPGCMPDSSAFGPFVTEDDAIRDAQSSSD